MSKGVIGVYCRVSSDSQKEGYSLDTQSEDGVNWCKMNGYDSEIFIDVTSGKNVTRKGLDELHQKLYSGDLKGVYIRDFNRIIRGSEIEFLFQKIVDDTKCLVIEGGRVIDLINSLSDNTYFIMKSMLGKIGRNEIHFNSRRGVIQSLNEGKVRGNRKFGYNKKKGIATINPEEAKIVKEIFRCFLLKSTTSMKSFSLKMNERFNLNISDVNYKRFLQYKGYTGVLNQKYMELSFETQIPQIIDLETFEKVQNKLESWKKKRKGRDKHDYLLKGMVNCKDCAEKMYKRGSKNKNGLYHYYYVCKNYGSKGYKNHYISDEEWEDLKCPGYKGNSINFSIIDDLAWEFLFKFLEDSNAIKKEYKKKFIQNRKEQDKLRGKEVYYRRKLEEFKKKKFETYNHYLEGKISLENFNQFDKRFDEEIEEINIRLSSLGETESQFDEIEVLEDYLTYLRTELQNLYLIPKSNFRDRKRVLDKYIDAIEIKRLSDNEYDINCIFAFDLEVERIGEDAAKKITLNGKNFYIRNTKS